MKYISDLDGLRAIAVIAVIAAHSLTGEAYLFGGMAAVRLFFVLSGFLITGILIDVRERGNAIGPALRAFYVRRALRIFPLYYAAIIIFTFILPFPGMRESVLWNLAYASNWYQAFGGNPGVSGPFWTLGIEEQFYLFWPLVILFTPFRYLTLVVVGFVILGPCASIVCINSGWHNLVPRATPCVFDSLCGGALLAIVTRSSGLHLLPAILFSIGGVALVLLSSLVTTQFIGFVAASGVTLAAIGLVGGAAHGLPRVASQVLSFGALVYIGRISYGIYVIHMFTTAIGTRMERIGGFDVGISHNGVSRFIFMTIASILIAAASWHLFESPLNNLKRYFPYSGKRKRLTDSPTSPHPNSSSDSATTSSVISSPTH